LEKRKAELESELRHKEFLLKREKQKLLDFERQEKLRVSKA
jgi:hypothetical protein